jgi:hypothetical protein
VNRTLSKRGVGINGVFKEIDDCPYKLLNTQFHPYYVETGFEVSELSVLKENGIVDSIYNQLDKAEVDTELNKNSYKIYQKNYALWREEC